jgi:hypothetical protein
MNTTNIAPSLTTLFSELVDGANNPGGAFVLNSGDAGLLRSLDKLSAAEASDSVHGGATIAAHVVHTQYGLELLNRWAREGGNPFANAKWDEAWKTSKVSEDEWRRIREQLRADAREWLEVLRTPREVTQIELNGMIGEVVHIAYHLGAIRQIASTARGPKEGTFKSS